ncbi:acyltransferase family protein [Gordonia crocea]|uniref:Acetyltransferase n=1 Tax=Gordonia crocea TaxID=589162 RepID=A0A7I9UW06_9ACTN|nr:acyltransferase [Gordonia crocea]GED97358.1 acetyltransferase [Gordonia crocea]
MSASTSPRPTLLSRVCAYTAAVFPSANRVARDTPTERDRAVDVARIASLLVVMFGHCFLVLATLTGSSLWVGNVLGEMPALRPITWILQVMPLFFLAGATSAAYGLDRAAPRRQPWGLWLFTRAQRLCRPVFVYLALWSLALAATRVILGPTAGAQLGEQCVALLWFIGVYLAVLAFVPALTRLSSPRSFAVLVVALLGLAAVADAARIRFDSLVPGMPNFLIVWLIPVVIGVAYSRRYLTTATALVMAAAAFVATIVLVAAGPYELALVVTGNETMSNVTPPTLVLGLHCVWMSLLFVAAADRIGRWAQRPHVWRWVAIGNGGAMTLYLWHIPAIVAAILILHTAGLDVYSPEQAGFWPLMALRALVFAVVMTLVFAALLPVEHRRLPWWDDRVTAAGGRAVAMGALVCAGGVAILLMAKQSLGDPVGWAALVVFVVTLGSARAVASARMEPQLVRDDREYEEPLARASSAESSPVPAE